MPCCWVETYTKISPGSGPSQTDVAALKKTDGGDILVYGSATLVKALLHHDLIDELRLMVFPVSIGGGLRIFDDTRESKKFGLKHSRAIDNGILTLEYQPIR
jgi:dihydrofolate reductase